MNIENERQLAEIILSIYNMKNKSKQIDECIVRESHHLQYIHASSVCNLDFCVSFYLHWENNRTTNVINNIPFPHFRSFE